MRTVCVCQGHADRVCASGSCWQFVCVKVMLTVCVRDVLTECVRQDHADSVRQGHADSVCASGSCWQCVSGSCWQSVCVRVTLCKREMEGNACKLVSWEYYEWMCYMCAHAFVKSVNCHFWWTSMKYGLQPQPLYFTTELRRLRIQWMSTLWSSFRANKSFAFY